MSQANRNMIRRSSCVVRLSLALISSLPIWASADAAAQHGPLRESALCRPKSLGGVPPGALYAERFSGGIPQGWSTFLAFPVAVPSEPERFCWVLAYRSFAGSRDASGFGAEEGCLREAVEKVEALVSDETTLPQPEVFLLNRNPVDAGVGGEMLGRIERTRPRRFLALARTIQDSGAVGGECAELFKGNIKPLPANQYPLIFL